MRQHTAEVRAAVLTALLLAVGSTAGCTSGEQAAGSRTTTGAGVMADAGGGAPGDAGVTGGSGAATPKVSLTPIDPGPPPTLTVPPRAPGEVARVVVTASGSGKAFRNERGEPAAEGRTYVVEVACAAGRPTAGTSYAIYDAAPGTWGHGEPLYSRPFPCDGQVQKTVHLGLPAGAVQIDVRGLPEDAVAAYAVIRRE
jgi:hypothetical protein